MSPNYQGLSAEYDARSNTYSRSRVPVFRICKHGFKRELKPEPSKCPCYKCTQETLHKA